MQNALFVPDIPFLNRFYNRNPTYTLSRNPTKVSEASEEDDYFSQPQLTRQMSRQTSRKPMPPTPGPPQVPPKSDEQEQRILERGDSRTPEPNLLGANELRRTNSLTSHIEDDHYAVLPHGVTLEGWTDEDVAALDDYVRHMLHSRRSRFKRSMRGFGKYIRKRKSFVLFQYFRANTYSSSRVFRHSIRFSHHSFWFYLGSLPYWLDLPGFSKGLHRSYCRLRFGCSLRYHG